MSSEIDRLITACYQNEALRAGILQAHRQLRAGGRPSKEVTELVTNLLFVEIKKLRPTLPDPETVEDWLDQVMDGVLVLAMTEREKPND